jgi:type IV pilus assembly protein PilA
LLKAVSEETEITGVSYRSARAVLTHRELDDGFTLIELMTVVLIMAVLIAIAIPSFLGAKGRASDRVAQTSLRIAFTNAKAIYVASNSFSDVTVSALRAEESSLNFTNAPSTAPKMISVASSSNGVVLAAQSMEGTCFVIADGGTPAGAVYGSLGSSSCDASNLPSIPTAIPTPLHASAGGGWARGW